MNNPFALPPRPCPALVSVTAGKVDRWQRSVRFAGGIAGRRLRQAAMLGCELSLALRLLESAYNCNITRQLRFELASIKKGL